MILGDGGLVVAAAEIVQILNVKRAMVFQLLAAPDFPEPVTNLSVGKVWLYSNVVKWADRAGRSVHRIPDRWVDVGHAVRRAAVQTAATRPGGPDKQTAGRPTS